MAANSCQLSHTTGESETLLKVTLMTLPLFFRRRHYFYFFQEAHHLHQVPSQLRFFNNKNILVLEMLLQDRLLVSSAWPWSQTLRLTLSMGGQVMVSASPALCDSQYQSSANPIVRQFSWCKGDRNLPHKEWIFFSFKNKYSDLDHFVKQGDPHHLLLLTVLGKPVCLLFKSHYICKTLFSSLFLFLFFFL